MADAGPQRHVRHELADTAFGLLVGTVAFARIGRPPATVDQLVVLHGAKDTTARHTALAELQAMTTRTSQYNPGNEIPEKSWAYRLLKRYLFADFGVYAGHDHSQSAAPGLLRTEAASPETATA